MRNRLSAILGALVCWLRGRHEWGTKFRRDHRWAQACLTCGRVRETTQPKRRNLRGDKSSLLTPPRNREMMVMRMNAPQPRTGLFSKQGKAVLGCVFAPVVALPPVSATPRIASKGVASKAAFSRSRAAPHATATRLHRRLGRVDRCTCDSVRPLNQCQPEGLVSALHSITSKTGMPKVVGLYLPQVSGALISQRSANGNNVRQTTGGLVVFTKFKGELDV
jgi:hypothetical protein